VSVVADRDRAPDRPHPAVGLTTQARGRGRVGAAGQRQWVVHADDEGMALGHARELTFGEVAGAAQTDAIAGKDVPPTSRRHGAVAAVAEHDRQVLLVVELDAIVAIVGPAGAELIDPSPAHTGDVDVDDRLGAVAAGDLADAR